MWNKYPEVAEAVNFDPQADGIFWISWKDFKYYLGSLESLCLRLGKEIIWAKGVKSDLGGV